MSKKFNDVVVPLFVRSLATSCALLATLSTGCEDNTWLGESADGLNLDRCFNSSCESKTSDKIAMPAVQTCTGVGAGSLVKVFEVPLASVVCPDNVDHGCSLTVQCTDQQRLEQSFCSLQTVKTISAADGSTFVLGTRSYDYGETLWLAHYDGNGEHLTAATIGNGGSLQTGGHVDYTADLALDVGGHAFVLAYEIDSGANADAPLVERTWIGEYGPDLSLVRVVLGVDGVGPSCLTIAADGDLIVAGDARQNAKHAVLAKLDRAGTLRFSQTGVRSRGRGAGVGMLGVSVDPAGNMTVASQRTAPVDEPGTFGLASYKADGSLGWDRVVDGKFAGGAHADFVDAAAGGLVFAGVLYDPALDWGSLGHKTRVLGVDRQGNPRYAYDIDGDWPELAAHRESGRVYILQSPFGSAQTLAELSADGSTCAQYALPADLNWTAMEFASNGDLVYANSDSVGRLHFTEPK